MTVAIPAEVEEFVSRQVDSGRYARAEVVLRAAMQLLRDEFESVESLKQIDAEIDRGEWVDAEEVSALARKSLAEINQSRE